MCTKRYLVPDDFSGFGVILKIIFRFKNTDHAAVERRPVTTDILKIHFVAAFDHGTKYGADFCDDSSPRCYNNDYYFAFTDRGMSGTESTGY